MSVKLVEILLLFESFYHNLPGVLLIRIVPTNYYLSLSSLRPSAAVEVDLT